MSAITLSSQLLAAARRRAGLTQRELAVQAGTAQSVVARIESGKTNPTIDTLERLVRAAGSALRIDLGKPAGADPVIELYKQDIDRTLLRENLKKTPDRRLREMVELLAFNNEARRAVRAAESDR